jgi:DNA polymerase
MLDTLTADAETYYDDRFSLKKYTTTTYVRNEKCKVHGIAFKWNDESPVWVPGHKVEDYLRGVNGETTELVCHNTMFDGLLLGQHYNWFPNKYRDTLSMARALNYFGVHDLDKLAKLHGLEGKQKKKALADVKGIWNLSDEQLQSLGEYAIDDVEMAYALYNKFRERFSEDELEIIHVTLRMYCQPTLCINTELLKQYQAEKKKEKDALAAKVGMTPKEIRGRASFKAAFEAKGIPLPMKYSPQSRGMIPATAKTDRAFTDLINDPQVGDLVKAKLAFASNIDITRADRFIEAVKPGAFGNDRFPVPLKYYGAHTGRFSGTDKVNVQNLRKKSDLRLAIEAPSGYVLLVRDLGQIEARVLAWLAGQDDLVKDFREMDQEEKPTQDVYTKFYNLAFGTNITREDEDKRFVGKAAILGLGYGMGAPKMFKQFFDTPDSKITPETCQMLVTTYRGTNYKIPQLWYFLDEQLTRIQHPDYRLEHGPLMFKHNAIELPNGLDIQYPRLSFHENSMGNAYWTGDFWKNIWGGATAENIVQALSRIILTSHMLVIDPHYPVVTHTHDELVLLVPESEAEEAYQFVGEAMAVPPDWAPNLPLASDGGWATNYSK